MCATVPSGRCSITSCPCLLSLLQGSHRGLARAPIICGHFSHAGIAPEWIHVPKNSLLSPPQGKIRRPMLWLLGVSCLLPLGVEAYNPTPDICCPLMIKSHLTPGACYLSDSCHSCISCTQEPFVPVTSSSVQCLLPLKFSFPLEHCILDGFGPCGHSLHHAFVVPFVPHSVSGGVACSVRATAANSLWP